jgi:hypothetical protein
MKRIYNEFCVNCNKKINPPKQKYCSYFCHYDYNNKEYINRSRLRSGIISNYRTQKNDYYKTLKPEKLLSIIKNGGETTLYIKRRELVRGGGIATK